MSTNEIEKTAEEQFVNQIHSLQREAARYLKERQETLKERKREYFLNIFKECTIAIAKKIQEETKKIKEIGGYQIFEYPLENEYQICIPDVIPEEVKKLLQKIYGGTAIIFSKDELNAFCFKPNLAENNPVQEEWVSELLK